MKPVELILANAAHDLGSKLEVFDNALGKRGAMKEIVGDHPDFQRTVARVFVRAMADEMPVAKLLAMLQAVGGPGTIDELMQRVNSAREAIRASDDVGRRQP